MRGVSPLEPASDMRKQPPHPNPSPARGEGSMARCGRLCRWTPDRRSGCAVACPGHRTNIAVVLRLDRRTHGGVCSALRLPAQATGWALRSRRRRRRSGPPSRPGRMQRQRNASRDPAQEFAAGASSNYRSQALPPAAREFRAGPRIGAPPAVSLVRGTAKEKGTAEAAPSLSSRMGGWIRNPCRPCRPCRRPASRACRSPSSAARRRALRW